MKIVYKLVPKVYLLQMGKVVSTKLFGNPILQHTKTLYRYRYSINTQFIVLFQSKNSSSITAILRRTVFFQTAKCTEVTISLYCSEILLNVKYNQRNFPISTTPLCFRFFIYIVHTNVPRKCQSFSLNRDIQWKLL